ncbi:MAG: RNA 2',3'-cyclic phosphodiesterase [Actinomycetota bacterium]|nr:RNA 2',3'-cyclic phosphodiesterase [Actinomycetota bacterium]
MRLFVALTPPDVVAEELAARVALLRELAPELRWSRPEQWHLTLAFLGEVGDAARDDIACRLERAARRHAPLPLSFAGGGRFGGRVLWAGVRGDREALRRLAESVRAAARRARLPVEERPYRPHLTLARAADVELRPLVEQLASFEGREWVAEELHLVRSRLGAGPGGTALYEPVASWPLGATVGGRR